MRLTPVLLVLRKAGVTRVLRFGRSTPIAPRAATAKRAETNALCAHTARGGVASVIGCRIDEADYVADRSEMTPNYLNEDSQSGKFNYI